MDEIISEWWIQLLKERRCPNTNKTVKTIRSYPQAVQDSVRVKISDHIKNAVLEVLRVMDVNKWLDLCAAITGCFDNFPQAVDGVNIAFNEIIKFVTVSFDGCKKNLPVRRETMEWRKYHWLELVHSLSRILVLVLKLRRPLTFEERDFHLPEIAVNDRRMLFVLVNRLSYFLKLKEIAIDTKCSLVTACVLIREILVDDREVLTRYHEEFLADLPERIDENEYELNVYRFLLGNAILNSWSGILFGAAPVATYLRFYTRLCERYSSDTRIILNLSRTLLTLIENDVFDEFMRDIYRVRIGLVDPLLSCVYMLVDHPVQSVRHSSRDLLKILVSYEEFRESMMRSLPAMLSDKRSYFVCLSALAGEVGSEALLASNEILQENLFVSVSDPDLVTYVTDALYNVMVRDNVTERNFPRWCEEWIVPLFACLHKERSVATPEIEKLLETLLTEYPAAIQFAIEKWLEPKNDRELRCIMTALKVYKKLDPACQEEISVRVTNSSYSGSQERTWKGIISERLLRHCLNHSDDDLRMSAFSLIVESLKSIEKYNEQDFNLIQHCLVYNVNNQEPATRQKFLTLARKMMRRFADSRAVLERNFAANPRSGELVRDKGNYFLFEDWLLHFCFANIYDNASFCRLNTILSMVSDYAVMIKDFELENSRIEDYWRRMLVPLRSSYDENKRLAAVVTKKLEIIKLYKDHESVRTLMGKGFDLCGKIEPPNVLTGAYLIQMLLEYPRLSETRSTTHTTEQLVISLLCQKLDQQISLAEEDFAEEVMDNPMYGVLFVVRLILREIDFSRICDDPQSDDEMEIKRSWSEIIARLIGLSFRMIKVVSPVVNECSAEGNLPAALQSSLESVLRRRGRGRREAEGWEEDLGDEATAAIRGIRMHDSGLRRGRSEVLRHCDRLTACYNSVMLSHGESCSFSRENARVFSNIMRVCEKLIADLADIERMAESESRLLTSLKVMRCELRKRIEIYKGERDKLRKPTAQMLLHCSWRSIKETCLFLGDVVSKVPVKRLIESELLTKEVVLAIGIELRRLLCEVKHRGAFEHAYVGFRNLVTALWQCPIRDLKELPRQWLEEVLGEIKQPVRNQEREFCSGGRRSGGLPYLVQAITCSESKCTNSGKLDALEVAMKNLCLSGEEMETCPPECVIHSLNILRALFKNAQLGNHVAPYVSRGVMVAIRASRSTIWSVRNSACLLFGAVMIRIFGVTREKDATWKRNRMTAKHFFRRYPELLQFLLNELRTAVQDVSIDLHSPSTLPSPQPHLALLLMILGRLCPLPIEDETGTDFSEFIQCINRSCEADSFKIRELGARALVPLICADSLVEELQDRFSSVKSKIGENNKLHGTLLQIENILTEMLEKKYMFDDGVREEVWIFIWETKTLLDEMSKESPYEIRVTYVKILHLIFRLDVSCAEHMYTLLNEKEVVDYGNGFDCHTPGCQGRGAYLETLHLIKFDVAAHIWLDSGSNGYMIAATLGMLNSAVEQAQIAGLVLLNYIMTERYGDVAGKGGTNLVTVNLQDLLCIQDEKKLKLVAPEVYSNADIISRFTDYMMTILSNAAKQKYLRKVTTKLKMPVISNYMLRGLIHLRDITDLCNPTTLPAPVMWLLPRIMARKSSYVSVGAFTCYGVIFFENLRDNVIMQPETVAQFREMLIKFSARDADLKQKLAVCELFNKYYDCFTHNFFKTDNRAMAMWLVPVRLLSDEEPLVRKRVTDMVQKYQSLCRECYRHRRPDWEFEDACLSQLSRSPFKAQETLVDCYVSLLERDDLIHLFVPIFGCMLSAYVNAINCEFTSKQNEDGVFEKGNPNALCEETTLGKLLYAKIIRFRVFVRDVIRRELDAIHVESLKEFFPSLIIPNFPTTLHDFFLEIMKYIIEGCPGQEERPASFVPEYLSELLELCDL